MRTLVAPLALLFVLAAAPARADIVFPSPTYQSRLETSARLVAGTAPAAERERLERAVARALFARRERLERCFADGGVRARTGTVRARLRFDRSVAPVLAEVVETSLGAVAARCVTEILPSLRASEAPQGDVTIDVLVSLRVVGVHR